MPLEVVHVEHVDDVDPVRRDLGDRQIATGIHQCLRDLAQQAESVLRVDLDDGVGLRRVVIDDDLYRHTMPRAEPAPARLCRLSPECIVEVETSLESSRDVLTYLLPPV